MNKPSTALLICGNVLVILVVVFVWLFVLDNRHFEIEIQEPAVIESIFIKAQPISGGQIKAWTLDRPVPKSFKGSFYGDYCFVIITVKYANSKTVESWIYCPNPDTMSTIVRAKITASEIIEQTH